MSFKKKQELYHEVPDNHSLAGLFPCKITKKRWTSVIQIQFVLKVFFEVDNMFNSYLNVNCHTD